MTIWEARPQQGDGFRVASPSAVETWASEIDELSHLAAVVPWQPILDVDGDLRGLDGVKVTEDFLRVLAVKPHLGRFFSSADALTEPEAVVLSHRLWVRQFGGDPAIVGNKIDLEGAGSSARVAIIGILPAEISSTEPLLPGNPEIFAPLAVGASQTDFGKRYLRVIARLAEGARIEEARTHLTAVSENLSHQFPETNAGWTGKIEGASEQIVASMRPSLMALSLAVGLVFLIACCNVGILQLSQTTARRREIAVRRALGAGPRRLAQKTLSECLLLTAFSGIAGVVLFHLGLTWYAPTPLRSDSSTSPCTLTIGSSAWVYSGASQYSFFSVSTRPSGLRVTTAFVSFGAVLEAPTGTEQSGAMAVVCDGSW